MAPESGEDRIGREVRWHGKGEEGGRVRKGAQEEEGGGGGGGREEREGRPIERRG